MSMELRAMAAGDWPRVADIYTQGIRTGVATFATECPPYESWDAAHLPHSRLVAVLDGGIVGWAALSPVSQRAVYAGVAEVSIYVDAACKGRGVGTRLLQALCEQSGAEGIWTLQSTVLAINEASLRLHKRCGFRTVGVRERLARDHHGVWRDVYLLERRSKLI